MSATDTVAEGLEEKGVRTFSAKEMAFNILGLMHPLVFDVAQIEPVWADVRRFPFGPLLQALTCPPSRSSMEEWTSSPTSPPLRPRFAPTSTSPLRPVAPSRSTTRSTLRPRAEPTPSRSTFRSRSLLAPTSPSPSPSSRLSTRRRSLRSFAALSTSTRSSS